MELTILLIISYLTGSLPSSIIISRVAKNIDIRDHGSGNAGATNTFRVLGKKAGFPVLFLDIFKGWLSVKLILLISNTYPLSPELFFENQLAFGISAVVGHLFPVYTGFRGGKGIATMLGILIGIQPYAALFSFCIFFVVFLISRYVSLGSIFASIAFPFFVILFLHSTNESLNLFSIFIPVLSLITHQKNIERLIRGEETKVKFGKN